MKSASVGDGGASADDADAYGQQQKKKKKETKKVGVTGTVAAFMQAYIALLSTLFFEHRDTAHWQAKQFDKCVDDRCEPGIRLVARREHKGLLRGLDINVFF
jgi:hypothetical protein